MNHWLLFNNAIRNEEKEKQVDVAHWRLAESPVISNNWSHIFLSAQTVDRPFSHQQVY